MVSPKSPKLFVIASMCFFSTFMLSQTSEFFCHTKDNPSPLNRVSSVNTIQRGSVDASEKIVVNVKFHFSTENEEFTGSDFEDFASNAVAQLNASFMPHNIVYKYRGFDKIDKEFSNITNSSSEFGLFNMFDLAEEYALNIFVVDKLYNSTGNAKAKSIKSNALAITFDLLRGVYNHPFFGAENSNVVLIHEVGHCLGLEHTFSEAFGTQLVNDLNSGDGIPDTPAEVYRGEPTINNKCKYIADYVDDSGQAFNPDTDLYMSYSTYKCVNRFSNGQVELMRYNLKHYTSLLKILTSSESLYQPFSGSYSSGFLYEFGDYSFSRLLSKRKLNDNELKDKKIKTRLPIGVYIIMRKNYNGAKTFSKIIKK